MQTYSFTSPEIIRKRIGQASTDHFAIYDSLAEFGRIAQENSATYGRNRNMGGSWTGGLGWGETIRLCQTGDLSCVAKSDAYLAKMEDHELATARHAWRNDVAGSIPDVQAFIAGHPLAMRRCAKVENAAAPLAIIADLTSSGGISANQVAERGAAILALVRALSVRRAVELYICTGLDAGRGQGASYIVARIETSPLDLSSAAFGIGHPAVSRGAFYGASYHHRTNCSGAWPYGGKPLTRAEMEAVFAPAMPHVTETLCLPGIYAVDPSVKHPARWLADQIAQHAPRALGEV